MHTAELSIFYNTVFGTNTSIRVVSLSWCTVYVNGIDRFLTVIIFSKVIVAIVYVAFTFKVVVMEAVPLDLSSHMLSINQQPIGFSLVRMDLQTLQ